MSDPTNTTEETQNGPNMASGAARAPSKIGMPIQVLFRDGRKFNGSVIQAGIIVGGPFTNNAVNVRVLTDGEPGVDPDMPLFRTVPHVSMAGEGDAIAWRNLSDAELPDIPQE